MVVVWWEECEDYRARDRLLDPSLCSVTHTDDVLWGTPS